jgi:aerobic carbon-monoxide dehydrogenase small subunit
MVTARDIVLRVPDADEDRIRLELAGHLCRCTGYNGIVRAIRRVLDEGIAEAEVSAVPSAAAVAPPPAIAAPSNVMIGEGLLASDAQSSTPLPTNTSVSRGWPAFADHDGRGTGADKETTAPASTASGSTASDSTPSGSTAPRSREASLRPALRIAQPPGIVWAAIQDPAFVASCVPGAAVLGSNGDQIEGEIQASLGPIQARFAGRAIVTFDEATRTGRLAGEGRDKTGGTRLSGEARFAVEADGSAATILRLDIAYSMRGPLSQFGRGPVIEAFASEIADQVGRNLEARLQGQAPPPSPGTIALLWRTLRRWFRGNHG